MSLKLQEFTRIPHHTISKSLDNLCSNANDENQPRFTLNTGTSTNDDDDDGESFPMLIVAIAAGVVGVIVLVAVLFMCREAARELTITTS